MEVTIKRRVPGAGSDLFMDDWSDEGEGMSIVKRRSVGVGNVSYCRQNKY